VACDMKPELLVDMPESTKSAAAGTNGTTNTHTITESITAEEQSNESNAETTPAATEQTEAVVEVVKKPANGEF
jgi:hypothetical protein